MGGDDIYNVMQSEKGVNKNFSVGCGGGITGGLRATLNGKIFAGENKKRLLRSKEESQTKV